MIVVIPAKNNAEIYKYVCAENDKGIYQGLSVFCKDVPLRLIYWGGMEAFLLGMPLASLSSLRPLLIDVGVDGGPPKL
ncbi:hypothetical protein SeMB42_g00722 [Synchytrium endobioticum]|uniref:Uncharacterized protein n=1 Tax=Synchytrium endobioticum TaxID=286115 RepID=A0A507DPD9_9FUNG|nr:hypothetical protein SeMB42_g00722 [Synchytrium endobioticum]